MKFEILNDGSGVFAYADPALQAAAEKFEARAADFAAGGIGRKRMIASIEQAMREHATLAAPYSLMAVILLRDGKPERALKTLQRGVAALGRLLPPGFAGRIEWRRAENQAYLDLLRLRVTCLSGLRQHKEAAAHACELLALDPDDGACIRFAAGHELLRAGDVAQACRLFRDFGRQYPPFCYELGLALFREGQLVAAATAFRRGIAGNPYIALGLTEGMVPNAYPVAHYDWLEGPHAAASYLGTYGDVWYQADEPNRFLYWLFNHSKVLLERAAIMAAKEARPFGELAQAGDALREEAEVTDAIDDALSAAIVQLRQTPEGMLWPWNTYQGNEAVTIH